VGVNAGLRWQSESSVGPGIHSLTSCRCDIDRILTIRSTTYTSEKEILTLLIADRYDQLEFFSTTRGAF